MRRDNIWRIGDVPEAEAGWFGMGDIPGYAADLRTVVKRGWGSRSCGITVPRQTTGVLDFHLVKFAAAMRFPKLALGRLSTHVRFPKGPTFGLTEHSSVKAPS